MIQPKHLPSADQYEFPTRPAEQVTDNIVNNLDLTGIVPIDDFQKLRGR